MNSPIDRYKSFMDSQFLGNKKSIDEAKSLISEGNGFGGIAVGIHALKQVKWTDLKPLDLIGAFREQGGTVPEIAACAYLEPMEAKLVGDSAEGKINYVVLVKNKGDKYTVKSVSISINPRNVASEKSPVEISLGLVAKAFSEMTDLAAAIKATNKAFGVRLNK